MKRCLAVLLFLLHWRGAGAESWALASHGMARKVEPRGVASCGDTLVAAVWPREEGSESITGLWVRQRSGSSWEHRVAGRFWDVMCGQGQTVWALVYGGDRLEKYSLSGSKLQEEKLPVRALAVREVGSTALLLRMVLGGQGELLWRHQGRTWQPWAMTPVSASDVETLTRENLLVFAGNGRRVAVVKRFFPHEVTVLDDKGAPVDVFPLRRREPGSEKFSVLGLVMLDDVAYLLVTLDQGRELWGVSLHDGHLSVDPVPTGAVRLFSWGGRLGLVGEHLEVWEAAR